MSMKICNVVLKQLILIIWPWTNYLLAWETIGEKGVAANII
jgi:hypothetical protein